MMNRSLRPALAFVLLVALGVPAQAHSLRVLVTRPVQSPGLKGTVYLSWGHLLPVDELVESADLGDYQILTPSASVRPLAHAGRSLQSNEFVFDEPGIYQVSATRKPYVYTSYINAEGKPSFARGPKAAADLPAGASDVQSARRYVFTKAIVACGQLPDGGEVKALGHGLEIVPRSTLTPAGFPVDSTFKATVLFNNNPLADAKVTAASTTLNPDGLPGVSAVTDAEGQVELDLNEPGTWVLEVSHKFPASDAEKAQFDQHSYSATLSIPVGESD